MKSIIVYYSLEGNTDYAAKRIAQLMGAELLRLETVKNYPQGRVSKYIFGGKSVVFGDVPKLQPYQFSAEDYDLIILGTPIWAGNFAPPLRTFMQENTIGQKEVALFACCGGGSADKTFRSLTQALGINGTKAELRLVNPLWKQNHVDIEKKIREFVEVIQ